MTLADKIMKLRREHDWSQEQLAEQLGKRCAQGLVDETRGVCTICLQILA